MAASFVIACPQCSKQVKVSEEHLGKRIRCKECQTVYPVQAPGEKPQPAATGKGKPPPPPKPKKAPPKEETPPPPPEKSPFLDDDDDGKDYVLAAVNDTLPRCPFCAKEMESHEALICLHCGYNTRTRRRPEVKAVYAHTGLELFLWWLPAIIVILFMIGCLVWYLIAWDLIVDWMAGSWFEDEPGPPTTYMAGLSPGAFRLYQALLILAIYVPCARFVYKRLVVNNKPPEKKIKEDW